MATALAFGSGLQFALAITIILTPSALYVKYRHGLSKMPGPFWASTSPLDRLWTAASGHQMLAHIKYHNKYGPFVRVGPNKVSFSDGALTPMIYGVNTRFVKCDFYRVFDTRISPWTAIDNIFTTLDEAYRKQLKRPVANAYPMSTMVDLEPMTNECIAIFERKLKGLEGLDVDFGKWLHWYAFHVLTSITFSNRLDCMEQETDVGDVIYNIECRLVYMAITGEAPWLNRWLLGNSVVFRLAEATPLRSCTSAGYIVNFVREQMAKYRVKDKEAPELRDQLSRMKRSDGDQVLLSDNELLTHAVGNVFAGADTTATSLRAMFYYLCKNRRCYKKLVRELDNAALSDPVTFAEANQREHFKACVREAMRLHPAVGQLLERVVPPGGADLGGVRLAEGTIIGANPWVMAQQASVYGKDVDVFRPERWLDADPAELKLMERNDLAFGAGARSCIGKKMSLLEMYKLVPQLLRKFHVELVDPVKEWDCMGTGSSTRLA